MAKVLVTDRRNGQVTTYEMNNGKSLRVGRIEQNDLVLNHSKVSRKHAIISMEEGYFKIKDLGSSNGTYINNTPIEKMKDKVIFAEDVIRIADFIVTVEIDETSASQMLEADSRLDNPPEYDESVQAGEIEPVKQDTPQDFDAPPKNAFDERATVDESHDGPFDSSSAPNPQIREYEPDFSVDIPVVRRMSAEEKKKQEILYQLKKAIHERVLQYMDLRKLDLSKTQDVEIRERTKKVIREIISEMSDEMPKWVSKRQVAKEVLDEALGLGPLEDFLVDPTITEVMVNNRDQIYIEREGLLELTPQRFSSDDAVMAAIERIVSPIGRRIDESSPMVDARLKDGSRVNAIIPPLAVKGPCVTIRRFSATPFMLPDLVNFRTLTPKMGDFLKRCVSGRKNIVVSGGTGSGKTTLLNVLSSFIPGEERIITIEVVTELQLLQEHWISLESRPPNIEGRGEVTVRDLVKNTLRMRPDRIVVGECRGGEAIDMIQAMNTGHDGSMTTLHSNSPHDTLARMETMVLMAGMELPIKAIRDQIRSAVELIVHTSRYSDGTRKISHISEVMEDVDEHYRLQVKNIYEFRQEGLDENGKVVGDYHATGYRPTFMDEFRARGMPIPDELFEE